MTGHVSWPSFGATAAKNQGSSHKDFPITASTHNPNMRSWDRFRSGLRSFWSPENRGSVSWPAAIPTASPRVIQRQQVDMPCDHEVGFAAARPLQRVHEAGERYPLRLPPAGSGEYSGRSSDTDCGVHEILLLRKVSSGRSHRFMMTTSRYSLGTTIVPSSALFIRAIRS